MFHPNILATECGGTLGMVHSITARLPVGEPGWSWAGHQGATGGVTVVEPKERSVSMTGGRWEHFPHDADMGIRGFGPTLPEAFAQAALALTAVVANPANVRQTTSLPIRCDAPDVELLLADWLNALIYTMS